MKDDAKENYQQIHKGTKGNRVIQGRGKAIPMTGFDDQYPFYCYCINERFPPVKRYRQGTNGDQDKSLLLRDPRSLEE